MTRCLNMKPWFTSWSEADYDIPTRRSKGLSNRGRSQSGSKPSICHPRVHNPPERVAGNKSHLLFPALASSKQGDRCHDKPSSYDSVRNQFKTLIKEVGLSEDASEFGRHSMRRGGSERKRQQTFCSEADAGWTRRHGLEIQHRQSGGGVPGRTEWLRLALIHNKRALDLYIKYNS